MMREKILDAVITLLLVGSALVVFSPVILILLRSVGLHENGSYFELGGYVDFLVWKPLYLNAFMRSLAAAGLSAVGSIVVAIPAAYVFAKIPFRGRSVLFFVYIVIMIMPFQVTMLPQYITAQTLHTYDTLAALILPGIFAPFSVFFMTQIMKTFPDDAIEAARIETSNIFVILWKIVLPNLRPGIICTAVLTFSEQWNMVVEPKTFMETSDRYPLAVLLSSSAELSDYAATVAFLLPPFLLFAFFEEEIVKGMGEYKLK